MTLLKWTHGLGHMVKMECEEIGIYETIIVGRRYYERPGMKLTHSISFILHLCICFQLMNCWVCELQLPPVSSVTKVYPQF